MPPDTILNGILNSFTAAADGYYPGLLHFGALLLSGIAMLGLGVEFVEAGASTEPIEIIRTVLFGIIKISLVYTVMEHIQDWGQGIIDTGDIIGSSISGIGVTPSDLYNSGLDLTTTMIRARGWAGWLLGVLNFSDFLFAIMITIIQFTWFAAGLLYLFVRVEAKALIALAPVVLCWAGVRFAHSTIYAWANELLSVSIKLLTMILVLAICMTQDAAWAAEINSLGLSLNLHFYYYLGLTLGEAAVIFALLWNIPRRLAGLIRVGGGVSSHSYGAEQFVGYAQAGAGIAAASLTAESAGELGSYVTRKLIS